MWWTANKLGFELAGGVANSVASKLADVVSNTESSEVGWDLIDGYRLDGEGNPIQTIATECNSFVACPTMNSAANYRDNNDAITGAVKDNHFQGGQSFGPLQPTGVSTDPAEAGNAVVAGVLDTYLPGDTNPAIF